MADAGDGLDDANFVVSVVNAQILKLTKEIDWVKEALALAKAGELRTGEFTFFDRLFDHQMNKTIVATDRQYAGMMFREAIQGCWFGLQNIRDDYRQAIAVGKASDTVKNFHHDLLLRFMEVQALLIAPIAPHFAEHLWKGLLGRETSIHNTRFPEVSRPLDVQLEMSAAYLSDCLKDFRQSVQKSTKKGGKKPTHGAVYVSLEYQEWQKRAIRFVRELYQKEKELPKDLAKLAAADPELKKDLKQVMNFVAVLREQLAKFGDVVFQETPMVQEKAVLEDQLDYVVGQLGLVELKVYSSTDPAAPNEGKQQQRSEVGRPSSSFWVAE